MILDLLNYDDSSLNDNVFKFRTNASNFKIKFNIKSSVTGNYPHLGLSVREGLLLVYKFTDEKNWYNIDAYARKSEVNVNMSHITDGKRIYDVIIYGPNLTDLTELKIEVSDEFQSDIISMTSNRKMMILGGLNSFGIGCTSSGVMFSNVLQRNFNSETKKIVFNNRNYLKDVYIYLKELNLPNVDVSILEVDYSNQSDEIVSKFLDKIITLLEKRSKHVICWMTVPEAKSDKRENALNILKKHNIIFIDLSFIYSKEYEDMCTYSHNFINDSANMFIYREISKALMEVVKWSI